MIKIDNMDFWGFKHAVRGMRNSYDSWNRSDSFKCDVVGCYFEDCPLYNNDAKGCNNGIYVIGENDLELMRKLIEAGSPHRKFLRQIFVSMDITAPLYWWKEFDTYKIGTTANSCSTMHTIHKKEFTLDDFSCEYLEPVSLNDLSFTIKRLNNYRKAFLEKSYKKIWWQMIQLLPSSYNQKRTVTMNYENVYSIIEQRSNHKLDEWKMFITALKNLPYVDKLFIHGEE